MKPVLLLLFLLFLLGGCGSADAPSAAAPVAEMQPAAAATPSPTLRQKVEHVVVIFLENHSFDSLYGHFPGANGVASTGGVVAQVDNSGQVLATLPASPGTRFPADLPNAPYLINNFYAMTDQVPNGNHGYYQNLIMMGGRQTADGAFTDYTMDRFCAFNDSATPMGGWDTTQLPLYALARQYTVLDSFFAGHIGPSLPGHVWLIAATTLLWPNAPPALVYQPVFQNGRVVSVTPKSQSAYVTPDGFVVDDAQPFNPPYQAGVPEDQRVPVQTLPTIGDTLSAAGVSWAWYGEGWNAAVAGNPAPSFQFHHQPFSYFANFAPGTAGRSHLQDLTDFERAVDRGIVPAVSFIKPIGETNEHPGYSTVLASEIEAAGLVARLQASPVWGSTVVFITYDDFGGYYDHVRPPTGDRFGPGQRLPCLVISPMARRGQVDHTQYDTTSIIRFIEWRFGLSPQIGSRQAAVPFNAFDVAP